MQPPSEFLPWPSYTQEEADAIKRVLLSNRVNYWTGDECRQFELEFAQFAGADFAVALSNGTVALELALRALGIGPGDDVVVTSRTFVASASCVVNVGATPIFADVCRDSQNITSDTIAAALTPSTKAVICVHLAGWPCDMDAIMQLADRHGLFVIEDCAQAHGANFLGRPVGAMGHVGCWSFCQDKIMTTGGEGGMVTTNDRDLWSFMWSYKDHGKSWESVYEQAHPPGFRWLHASFGTNFRMTELQAVIGRIQLKRMDGWTRRRQLYCEAIWAEASKHPACRVPLPPQGLGHAGYKCYIFVEPLALAPGWNRDRIMAAINEAGVPCYSGSCSEVYLERCFHDAGLAPPQPLPLARELGETSLMFLVHPSLTENNIVETCQVLGDVLTKASAQTEPGFTL